jgi:multiple sugar transport system permease protein
MTARVTLKTLFYLMLTVFALVSFGPVIWLLLTSIKPYRDIYTFPVVYFPRSVSLANYVAVFAQHSFARYIFNSVFIGVAATAVCVGTSGLAAYGLSRFRLRTSPFFLMVILGFSAFPYIASVIPLFQALRALRLLNSYFSLILPYIAFNIPFSVWLTTAYFREVPLSIEDAAKIDGLSRMGTFVKIFLPLSAPVVATVCIIVFINCWNEFLFALVLISKNAMRTIPAGIALFPGEYAFPWETISAAAFMSIVPIIVFIILFQNMIISGLTAGSVKY